MKPSTLAFEPNPIGFGPKDTLGFHQLSLDSQSSTPMALEFSFVLLAFFQAVFLILDKWTTSASIHAGVPVLILTLGATL